ncbi:MAG: hypothetical protein JWP52_1099, partial [Rhizobacter sp.]|nr:hypothetical protein [Rhizobacter sp.]
FEVSQPMSPELRTRLGGNQPIDRVKVAQLLLTAAGSADVESPTHAKSEGDGKPLGDVKVTAKATVLALDFDMTPLGVANPDPSPQPDTPLNAKPNAKADAKPDTCHARQLTSTDEEKEQIAQTVQALNALRRQFAAVIFVAFPRTSCREQLLRREFLVQAQCTGLAETAPPPGTDGGGELYVASPTLLTDSSQSVSQYMHTLDSHVEKETDQDWPATFPSIGNLTRLALEARQEQGKDLKLKPESRKVLEWQCRTASRAIEPRLVEEEPVLLERHGHSIEARYTPAFIDWTALTEERVVTLPLELTNEPDPGSTTRPNASRKGEWRFSDPRALLDLNVSAVMVALDGGMNSDKHWTPAFIGPIAGVAIHAAAAASAPLEEVGSWGAFAADAVAGLLFLFVWATLDLKVAGGRVRGHVASAASMRWFRRKRFVVSVLPCALVAAAGWLLFLGVAHGLSVSVSRFWDVALAIKDSESLVLVLATIAAFLSLCVGIPVMAAIAIHGWCLGQRRSLVADMPWLTRVLRLLLPLAVAVFIASLAVDVSFASLLSRALTVGYFNVSLLLLGLLVHSYVEVTGVHAGHEEPAAAHAATANHTPHAKPSLRAKQHTVEKHEWRWLAAVRAGLQALRLGPRVMGRARWLDALLKPIVWFGVPVAAICVLMRPH